MKNLAEQRFGRLEVKEFVGKDRHGTPLWHCICNCGAVTVARSSNLMSGATKSCGCLRKDWIRELQRKHGHTGGGSSSSTYNSWQHMKRRCYNPNNQDYADYGGRGIKVCDRWLNSFENFLVDMGPCPKGMSLGRLDNDGGYCPENCKWSTQEEQCNNKRSSRWFDYKGEHLTVAQLASKFELDYFTLYRRICRNNWSLERALTTPLLRQGGNS